MPSYIVSQLQSKQIQYLAFGITCIGFYSFLRMWPKYVKHCKVCRNSLPGFLTSKHRHGDQHRLTYPGTKIVESAV